jgi:UDP-N-acetylglucosamine diphosphorylase/glucosamine-1-phosphate N-acetyltransferase
MPFHLCIFEDERYRQLYPISPTRPVYLLRCGIDLLFEKIARRYPQAKLHFFCRNYLAPVLREQFPTIPVNQIEVDNCLLINGRFILTDELPEPTEENLVWRCKDEVVAAWLSGERLQQMLHAADGIIRQEAFHGLPSRELQGTLISYSWELVHQNAAQIAREFSLLNLGGQILGRIHPNATLLNEKYIFIGEGARIYPGVVLDAENGPIYIDKNATIMANAVLQGPCFVGENSLIKIGAKIYHGTSIGERCKVGGEVEASIIHGYSNKQHEGFLGHSYLGQWVNLGADSNNSDLKNNYSRVKAYVDGQMVDTGLTFVGLIMGDHAKCGINTMFNTGSVVGVMSNVFGAGFTPKFIPSFTWGGIEKMDVYDCDKALETARRVMKRRHVEMSDAQEKMLREVFAMTERERSAEESRLENRG